MCRNTLTSIGAVASIVALLALAACGGGSGSPPESAPQPVHDLDLPTLDIEATRQAPVIRFGNELRVGGMPPPGRGALASAATHGDAAVRYARLRDGLGAAELTDYLSADTSFGDGVPAALPRGAGCALRRRHHDRADRRDRPRRAAPQRQPAARLSTHRRSDARFRGGCSSGHRHRSHHGRRSDPRRIRPPRGLGIGSRGRRRGG